MLEEANVGQLNVRDHAPATEPAGGAHREADQFDTEMVSANLAGDRQSVALPFPAGRFERIQTHGSVRLAVNQSESMERVRLLIALIAVVAREQALFANEHRTT
jgi:hypothetical protein